LADANAMRTPDVASFFHDAFTGQVRGKNLGLVSIFVSPEVDLEEAGRAAKKVLAAWPADRYALTSALLVDAELDRLLKRDTWLLSGLAAAGIGLTLLAARTRLRPALVALSAILLTLGFLWLALSALRVPLTLVTLLVFPFVLGIGVDASIYMCEHQEFSTDRVALLVKHIRPLLGSTMTTLLGFAALVVVPYAPVRQLGIATSTGLTLALIVALLWVPMFSPITRPRRPRT
jgi:predicted RND superfamily exporter protein